MGFEPVRRRGRVWEDARKLHETIMEFPFQTTGSNERAFERGFATTLMASKKNYNCKVFTQIDKESPVQGVYCFGKKQRPDMTLNENGIAVEMKLVTYEGLKSAIGQGYLIRLKYKFVFLILIVSENIKMVFEKIASGQEKDLEDTWTTWHER